MLAMLVGAPPAQAGTDELCAEQANGVPGPQPKYPEWWDLSLTDAQRETRWTGATSIYDVGSAAPPVGSGRVIWDKPSKRLFFEFDINGDPTFDQNQDIVMVAVSDPSGTEPDLFIQFQPLGVCSPLLSCSGQGKAITSSWVKYSQATVGATVSWSTLDVNNPSTDWTVLDPWVEVRRYFANGGFNYDWKLKFALEIPVDLATGEAWSDLRVYANAVMYMQGTSGSAVEYPLLCDPLTPSSNDCLVFSSGFPSLPGGLPVASIDNLWTHVTTGSSASCEGVEVIRQMVGSDYQTTMAPLPNSTVLYEYPGYTIPKLVGARLRAGFFNDTSNSLVTDDLEATFSIANWGLQWSTWNGASWDEIGSATLTGTVAAGNYGGGSGQGEIETDLPWVPASSGLSLTNDHQCMHVRLTPGGGGINFKRDSVYRNMDLVDASVFRRPVDLDMSERMLPEGQVDNDIYLLVHTENMPSVEQCNESGQSLRGCADGGPLVLGPIEGGNIKQLEKVLEGQPIGQAAGQTTGQAGALAGAGGGGSPAAGLPEPMNAQQPVEVEPWQDFDNQPQYATLEDLPKYVMYGFVDTGGTINLPDAPDTKVLKGFSQFGYYIQHDGEPSQGWEHYVTAPGAEPIAESPGLYRIHVEPEQVVALASTVRAIDGVQTECGVLPDPDQKMTPEEELAKTEQMLLDGLQGQLKDQVVVEPSFGCEPPPLREPCVLGNCAPHSPISYVNGSRYVGEWTEEAIAAVYDRQRPNGLAAGGSASAAEAEIDDLDDELGELAGGTREGCCAQASVDPQARRRGAAGFSAMAVMLLLLRRGRRRRRH